MLPLVLQGIASGIVTGCVYALIALSLVIVYKSSDVINFAAGDVMSEATSACLRYCGLTCLRSHLSICRTRDLLHWSVV